MRDFSADDVAAVRRAFMAVHVLSDQTWDAIERKLSVRTVRRGEVLTKEGERERSFAVVLEGFQRLYFATERADVTVALVYPPNFSGVPDSFFLGTPSSYRLESLTPGRMLCLGREAFLLLAERHHDLATWTWKLLARAGAGRGKRERELMTLSAAERYDRLVCEAPQVFQYAAQKHIASYLGMTPETLSRVRAQRGAS